MAVVLPLLSPFLFPFLFLFFLPPTLASFIVDPVTAKAATCEPVPLQWQGGKAPWTLSIVAPDGSTLESLGTFQGTSFHWTVDLDAGTVVAARLTDAAGATATSNSFTIQDGTTGCNQFVAVPPPQGTTASVPTETQGTASTGSVPSETQASTVSSDPPASAARAAASVARAAASATRVAGASSASTASQSSAKPTATGPPATTSSSSNSSSTPQGPYPESSSSALPSYQTTRRKTNVGTVFAILIPCLILLVTLGLCFMRWRRRRRAFLSTEPWQTLGPSALEAQPVPSRWFTAEKYRRTVDGRSAELDAPEAKQVQGPSAAAAQASTPQWFNRPEYRRASARRSPALGEAHEAETQRPTLDIATNTAAAVPAAPQSAFTPGTGAAFTPGAVYTHTSAGSKSPVAIPTSESTAASAAVQTLQAQIHALMQENAVLANLASPPAESPPPAYV